MKHSVYLLATLEPSQIGVDWISATATEYSVKTQLHALATRVLHAEVTAGDEARPWHSGGYVGWQSAHVKLGERPDSYVCHLGGSAAFYNWLHLLEAQVNVTRLDLQVTVPNVPLYCDLAQSAFERIDEDATLQAQARTYRWYVGRPTGSTLYVGSPKSDVLLRLYDKGAESPLEYPPGSWRYEVQARHGVAGAIAAGLAYGHGSALAGDSEVYERFLSRGVRPAFRASGRRVLGKLESPLRDAQRTLSWLDRQVRPAVARLGRRGFAGAADAILRPLLASGVAA